MNLLKVCIDARLYSGAFGGVEQVVIGLASGLAQLESAAESYYFLVYEDSKDWLLPYLPANANLLTTAPPQPVPQRSKWHLKVRTKAANIVGKGRELGLIPQVKIHPPMSDGTIESTDIAVVHFPRQGAFLTSVPSIYHPHDLQHVHLPQYFKPQTLHEREMHHRAFCNQAQIVAVASQWVKADIISHYGLSSAKVNIVPLAPPLSAYNHATDDEINLVANAYQLPEVFIFYPAQTWEHKNHVRLLEALAILRDEYNLVVHFVSSGTLSNYYQVIKAQVRKLHLEEQVRFLGFVSPHDLHCLYSLSTAVVIPTLFEAASFPLWEAFLAGRPAACSNVTSLPEQAGDAALVFDPYNSREIAKSIYKIVTDPNLRQELAEKGRNRVAKFTWERTARHFRAHYRRLGKRELSAEDISLLASAETFF